MSTTTTIVFVTCSEFPYGTDDDRVAFEPLRKFGLVVQPVAWTDSAVAWSSFDGVIFRSCWDYHLQPAKFKQWLSRLRSERISCLNPLDVIEWNIDKFYLQDLQKRGVRVTPTVWLKKDQTVNLRRLLEREGWDQAVVKPAVAGTAYQTWLTTPDQAGQHQAQLEQMLSTKNVLVQKFLPEIIGQGEWSLIFFDKQFCHAVVKRARAGDFRVQSDFGGTFTVENPPPVVIETAQYILAQVPDPLLYARIDGLMLAGQFTLMELELIEPELFLRATPDAPRIFAEAIDKATKWHELHNS